MQRATEPPKPHYHGHRTRLRQRILEKGAETLSDYEILETLLFSAQPRRDTKPVAKELLQHFGSLAGVLSAEPRALQQVNDMGPAAIALCRIVKEAAARLSREQLSDSPIISSWDKLLAYCRITMGHERIEHFRLLFLDRKNRLIADEVQQRGTVDHAPVYPREVVKRCLDLDASAVILVHNHPSGDPTPSRADIQMTKEIADAAGRIGIVVHDHIVIGKAGHASFKALGLL